MSDLNRTGEPRDDKSTTPQADAQVATPIWQPTPHAMAKGLGWFSIALGLAELLAPGATARATGAQHGKNLLQAYGAREIATGIGLLAAKDPQPWLWARVAGDAMDLATLATDLGAGNQKRRNAAWSMLAVMGVTALDVWAAETARRAAAAQQATPSRDERVETAPSTDEARTKAREVPQPVPQDLPSSPVLKPPTLH